MRNLVAVLSIIVLADVSLARAQDPVLQLLHQRNLEQQAALVRAQAREAQQLARAREIMQAREAAAGREPFDPAFTAYWVDRLSKLSVQQLDAIAAQGPGSNLLDAVVAAEGTTARNTAAAVPAPAFGDSGTNLVFTRLTPCRIVDTRSMAGGPLLAGGPVDFVVAGTAGFSSQGGSPAGCGVPTGATSVAVNVTVTQTAGAGDLRAWPYGSVIPSASIINYKAANTLANGLIVPICDPATTTCTYDLSLMADTSGTHVVIDVMGFFMKPSALGTLKTFTIETIGLGTTHLPDDGTCTNYLGASVSVYAPGAGEILVTAKVQTSVIHITGVSDNAYYGIATGNGSCTGPGFAFGNASYVYVNSAIGSAPFVYWDTVTFRQTVTAAGNYTFYLNGAKTTGAAGSILSLYTAMRATYHPQ